MDPGLTLLSSACSALITAATVLASTDVMVWTTST